MGMRRSTTLTAVPTGVELHGSDFASVVVSSTLVSGRTHVEVNVRVFSAFESEAQLVLGPGPENVDQDEHRSVETRIIPTTTSCIAPGYSVSVPR